MESLDDIKSYNYSPVEQIMHAYDFIRGNTSIKNSSSFSVLFNTILEDLGIDSRVVSFLDTETNKEYFRNEVYIKDSKYNIDGIYYFDLTADSHLINDYLSTYKHFAMTKEEMTFYDGDKYIQEGFSYLSKLDINRYKEYIAREDYSSVPYRLYKGVNYMANRLYGTQLYIKNKKNVTLDKQDMISKTDDLYRRFNKPLYAKDLLKILYMVRSNEFFKEPDKHSMLPNSFLSIMINSHWSFEDDPFMFMINKYRKSEILIRHQETILKRFINYHESNSKSRV